MKYEAVRVLLGVEIHPGAAAAVFANLIPRFDTAGLNRLEKGEALLGAEAYISAAALVALVFVAASLFAVQALSPGTRSRQLVNNFIFFIGSRFLYRQSSIEAAAGTIPPDGIALRKLILECGACFLL